MPARCVGVFHPELIPIGFIEMHMKLLNIANTFCKCLSKYSHSESVCVKDILLLQITKHLESLLRILTIKISF